MTVESALAAGAALVAIAFSMSTFEGWLERRQPQQLAWSIALAMFAAGSGALWWGAAGGWSGPTFRIFWTFGAIANVPVLALGTSYLLAPRRLADRTAAVVALVTAFAAGVSVAAPFRSPVPGDRLPQGSEVFGPLPRFFAAFLSAGGASVILAGAVWSIWRYWRRRESRSTRMVIANSLIAAGTLTLSASGLLNSVLGEMRAFAVTLAAGVTMLFVGFIVASTR